MAPPQPELMEDLVEEILLRFPPDDPGSLARAALVCKGWCRVISGLNFRRRFRERHRAPPMLGFLCNLVEYYEDEEGDYRQYVARFVSTSSFCPVHADHIHCRVLDARHGRVLLWNMPPGADLVVWNPFTDERRELPALPHYDPCSWNAAVLCAAHGACNHLDCQQGPFLVVFVCTSFGTMPVYVYSSQAGAWSQPIYGPPSPPYGIDMVPTALVGNALYFVIDASNSILKYDVVTRDISVVHLPPVSIVDFAVLITTKDGGLGVARLEDSRLYLWSMEVGPTGDVGWVQTRVVQIDTLLPADTSISYDFVGFAHGAGVFFVGTDIGLFCIDLKPGLATNVCEDECGQGGLHGVVPYTSFYTPDLHQYGLVPVRIQ